MIVINCSLHFIFITYFPPMFSQRQLQELVSSQGVARSVCAPTQTAGLTRSGSVELMLPMEVGWEGPRSLGEHPDGMFMASQMRVFYMGNPGKIWCFLWILREHGMHRRPFSIG